MEVKKMSEWSLDGTTFIVNGVLDGPTADAMISAMKAGGTYVLDLDGVTDIKFAALRRLLRARQKGLHFSAVNASPAVAEKFEDTGVSAFIPVCRRPKPLQREVWAEFGQSYLSKSYNSADGDSMIKIYDDRVPKQLVAQEKMVARAVMCFGLPTPLVGTLYEDASGTALDFERIEGKRSFSRIVSEEPGRLDEIGRRFARMCRRLHETPCDTAIFSDRKMFYRRALAACSELSTEEKAKVSAFIDKIPAATTCLHGDMQLSNVITDGTEDLWIDLSDFGYGYPLLDMGMWYFQCQLNDERHTLNLFHLTLNDMRRLWDVFVEEYFQAGTAAEKEAVARSVEPYAALHMLYLGSTYGFAPGMIEFVKEKLCV